MSIGKIIVALRKRVPKLQEGELFAYNQGRRMERLFWRTKIRKEVENLFCNDCCSSDQTEIILKLQKRLLKKEPEKEAKE